MSAPEIVSTAPPLGAGTQTPVAITTTGLTRRYGTLVAVDHLDLRVESGSIFGLLGPNGAGKSTTIMMLITLLPPSEGGAMVAGYDIIRSPASVRRHIGYVPQSVSADGALTGAENLRLSARLYGLPRSERAERISEALEFMGLREHADALVKKYSGGMVRRLELAQAMLHRPAVLFLDEPTIGLDPIARHAVWERLRELRQRFGMTVFLTTHDMEEAEALCGTLGIMHSGKLAALGAPEALKKQVGADATLDDVFIHFAGASLGDADSEGGRYSDVRRTRRTATRLG